MGEKEIIRLKNVMKHYQMGEEIVRAVDGINISIEKGNFVAILGPSGSGKSTSMNLVGSLDLATRGEIYLGNENIEDLEESELAQVRGKKIGFIFQQFNLIPNLTAKGNVMLPMMFQGVEKEERIKRAEMVLKTVGLEERMNHYPKQLSGGQQQRVAIARALSNNPEVILADEPTGNLDSKTEKKVLEILTEMNKKGKTIIMITHSEKLARNHAKKIYFLKDGKVERTETRKNKTWKVIS